jgi:hypothetical protein
MNRHQELWIDGQEYDLVHISHNTYWEVIRVRIPDTCESEGLAYESVENIPR